MLIEVLLVMLVFTLLLLGFISPARLLLQALRQMREVCMAVH